MNPISKTVDSLDWMTLALVISLFILTLGKYLFENKFFIFLILPFNNKYMVLSSKKGRLLNWFHILITQFQIINFSLFLFLIQGTWGDLSTQHIRYPFLFIYAGVLFFQLLKILLQFLKGFTFNTQELVLDMIYSKTTYLNYSSLVVFLGNVLLIYVLKDSKTVIYIVISLIIFINAIGLVKLLKNHQKAVVYYLFYFILYLCTLEIAPLVVIGSYLKG
ncbi:MAG: DUF4271 domain-containing protein [Bacteroidota bacterium]